MIKGTEKKKKVRTPIAAGAESRVCVPATRENRDPEIMSGLSGNFCSSRHIGHASTQVCIVRKMSLL